MYTPPDHRGSKKILNFLLPTSEKIEIPKDLKPRFSFIIVNCLIYSYLNFAAMPKLKKARASAADEAVTSPVESETEMNQSQSQKDNPS